MCGSSVRTGFILFFFMNLFCDTTENICLFTGVHATSTKLNDLIALLTDLKVALIDRKLIIGDLNYTMKIYSEQLPQNCSFYNTQKVIYFA